jgi:branched-chain amino acid transport system substrate-binding protein
MHRRIALVTAAVLAFATPAAAQVKIAFIESLSGPFANIGGAGLSHFQAIADRINAAGGVLGGQKIEIVPMDNKGSPQETLIVFKAVVDQGIRFVTQGNGSGVAAAIIDAVDKHNARNPDQAVLYLNYAAVDPDLTNTKCSFWHFRFDANTDQKMGALTDYLQPLKAVKSVYVLGQDYAHGHQFARVAEAMLKQKRPDIKIVGNDLHPIGKVKDFSPYVAKIKASGADAVLTGNWGNDVMLLVKAAADAGLKIPFYTYYGGGMGIAPALGEAGVGRVVQITEWHLNLAPEKNEQFLVDFHKKYKPIDYYYSRINTQMMMLAKAIQQAKSTEPKKVALALEGMRFEGEGGEAWMRKEDHQLMQPLYISTYAKVDGKAVKFGAEDTSYAFKTDARIDARVTELPTTCNMKRP